MAHLVCQVLHRADRITFLWSERSASFEPYHLEGAERANLLSVAEQIHGQLTEGAAPSALGQRLYRAIFRLDASDPGAAGVVQPWLNTVLQSNSIESIEFLSDLPGSIPWNALCHDGATCWASQFEIGAGRRVNILRQNPVQINPVTLLAADSELADQLTESQRPALNPLRESGHLLHNMPSLVDELKKRAPDVLMLLVRFEHGRLWLGADSFSVADLQSWLAEPSDGNPDPLIILMGVGTGSDQPAWQALIGEATACFSGLVANQALLSGPRAFGTGQALAQRFVEGNASVGAILRSLSQDHGPTGLAFHAFCPPQLIVAQDPATVSPAPPAESGPLPEKPYRPFAAFSASDRALFLGREEETLRGAMLLDEAATQAVLLHGAPGSGKTSYLQAGLLPFLEEDSVGYRVLRDRSPVDGPVAETDYPPLILRATNDLAGQFADALSVFCAQPYRYTTPSGSDVSIDLPGILNKAISSGKLPAADASSSTAIQPSVGAGAIKTTPAAGDDEEVAPQELWIALRDDRRALARILDAVTRALPFELVIVVDQGEELISLVRTAQHRERRAKALSMLAELADAAPRCKLIYCVRSQSVGQLVSLLPGGVMPATWRNYFLPQLAEADMVTALQAPTNREELPYSTEIPSEKYGFAFEDGMAQQVVAEAIEAGAASQQSPLAIIQAVGALLFQAQAVEKNQNVMRMADVKALGGVKDALMKHVERSIEKLKLSKASQRSLRKLISQLYVGHSDGTLSRDLVPASDLKSHWAGSPDPVETVVNQAADQAELFEIQQLMIGGHRDVYVSLPQDSLAHLGRRIDGEKDLAVYGKSMVRETLWIMIPFAFLCAVMSWFGTRWYMARAGDTGDPDAKMVSKEEAEKQIATQVKLAYASITRRPLYFGQIARAEQALRADNALRARQILREEPASRNYFEDPRDKEQKSLRFPDLRGFEWRCLWKQLHSERYLLAGHRGAVASVTASANGKRAASAGMRTDAKDDGAIRVWNLETGELLAVLVGPKVRVSSVAFSPDGNTLASAHEDKEIRIWDLSKLGKEFVRVEKETKSLKGHDSSINAVVFGKDDKTLYSAGTDKAVIVWDVAAGKEKFPAMKEHGAAVLALAISSDGKTLVSGGAENQLVLWDADTGKKRQSVTTPFHSIAALSMSPDGKTLAAGGVDRNVDTENGALRLYDVGSAKEPRATFNHGSAVLALAFLADGDTIASGGKDAVVRSWNVKTGQPDHKWVGHYGAITSLAFAKESLVSGSVDSTVKVWNPDQSSGADVLRAHADGVTSLALTANNTLLASGGRDGSVGLWNPAAGKAAKLSDVNGKELKGLNAGSGAVTGVAFSNYKDKIFLAASLRDGKKGGAIKVWQLEGNHKDGYKATEKHTFKGHDGGTTCLAFHPDSVQGNYLVSGGADSLVKVWNIDKGEERNTFKGHKGEVRCVLFAPDGRSFLSGGKDGNVCIHDLDHDDVYTMSDVSANSIESLAIVPLARPGGEGEGINGLVTGGPDKALRFSVYKKEGKGKAIHDDVTIARPHRDAITSVTFNSKLGIGFSASRDHTVTLFDLDAPLGLSRVAFNERHVFHGHTQAVRAMVLASDESFLATASEDGTIRIWRTVSAEETAKVDGK